MTEKLDDSGKTRTFPQMEKQWIRAVFLEYDDTLEHRVFPCRRDGFSHPMILGP